jgi:hypothetical protein
MRVYCLEMVKYLVQTIDFLWAELVLDLRKLLLYAVQTFGQFCLTKLSILYPLKVGNDAFDLTRYLQPSLDAIDLRWRHGSVPQEVAADECTELSRVVTDSSYAFFEATIVSYDTITDVQCSEYASHSGP